MARVTNERFAPGDGALTSTDGAHPHICSLAGLGADWRRGWFLGSPTEVVAILPSVRSLRGLSTGGTTHIRVVAMRPVRSGRDGRRASPLLSGDATATVDSAQGVLTR